jgi:hypothetical protein
MKKPLLIKRKREIIIEVIPSLKKRKKSGESPRAEITSTLMMSKRIDEFEDEVRRKLESEMKIFSCTVHSQKFLRSLVPSLREKKEC